VRQGWLIWYASVQRLAYQGQFALQKEATFSRLGTVLHLKRFFALHCLGHRMRLEILRDRALLCFALGGG